MKTVDSPLPGGGAGSALPARPGAPGAGGCRVLGGAYGEEGFSFEWHEVARGAGWDWAGRMPPRSVEVCLNLKGRATVGRGSGAWVLADNTAGFCVRGDGPMVARRDEGERHEFFTLRLSFGFLRAHLERRPAGLDPLILRVVAGESDVAGGGAVGPITARQSSLLRTFHEPPVLAGARSLWFRGKALELLSEVLFQPGDGELFCSRQKRIARDRVEKAMVILRQRMEQPPTLEELGRQVGCSPYYLSRTFSEESGMTIPQYLRRIRLERAAELLRAGRHNVTEAATEVGYNSLSHFSAAFHELFGCCPGLYPLPMLGSHEPGGNGKQRG